MSVFAALVLACLGLWLFAPLVHRLAPDFRMTKTGPAEFPVVVRIARTGVVVTNGSEGPWHCQVALRETQPVAIDLESRESGTLPYARFVAGGRSLTDVAGHRRAHRGIAVHCSDAGGGDHLTHFIEWLRIW